MSPKFVLLLGSYDDETKELLKNLKNKLVGDFRAEEVFILSLNTLYAFIADSYQVIVECWSETDATIFIFQKGQLNEIDELDFEVSPNKAAEEYMRKNFRAQTFAEITVLEKLETIFSTALLTLVIREREETRGGELVELTYLATSYKGDKMWFLKKDGLPISTMVKELLVALKIGLATFQDSAELATESSRIIRAELARRRALSK
jgi:hypothetical protein